MPHCCFRHIGSAGPRRRTDLDASALEAVERGQAAGAAMYWLNGLAVAPGAVPATTHPTRCERSYARPCVAHQLERGLIAARMKAGRELKAERGGYTGFGSPPFGWRAEGGELVVDDDEQRVVD